MSLATESAALTKETLSSIEQQGSGYFSLYLNSLSIESRDTALLNYATEKRNEIVERNKANEKALLSKGTSQNQSLSGLPAEARAVECSPMFDVDQDQSVNWIVVKNFFDLWKVEATATVTLNSKGNISGLAHNGSQLSGTSFLVSWSEGIVQTHFTPRVGVVNVKGTLSYGVYSDSKGGLLTLNCPAPL